MIIHSLLQSSKSVLQQTHTDLIIVLFLKGVLNWSSFCNYKSGKKIDCQANMEPFRHYSVK